MREDPIMAEMRRLREEYAASLNHDAQAIYQDLLRRQAQTTRELVRRPPREPQVSARHRRENNEPAATT